MLNEEKLGDLYQGPDEISEAIMPQSREGTRVMAVVAAISDPGSVQGSRDEDVDGSHPVSSISSLTPFIFRPSSVNVHTSPGSMWLFNAVVKQFVQLFLP